MTVMFNIAKHGKQTNKNNNNHQKQVSDDVFLVPFTYYLQQGKVAYAFNPSNREAEAFGSLSSWTARAT